MVEQKRAREKAEQDENDQSVSSESDHKGKNNRRMLFSARNHNHNKYK